MNLTVGGVIAVEYHCGTAGPQIRGDQSTTDLLVGIGVPSNG